MHTINYSGPEVFSGPSAFSNRKECLMIEQNNVPSLAELKEVSAELGHIRSLRKAAELLRVPFKGVKVR